MSSWGTPEDLDNNLVALLKDPPFPAFLQKQDLSILGMKQLT